MLAGYHSTQGNRQTVDLLRGFRILFLPFVIRDVFDDVDVDISVPGVAETDDVQGILLRYFLYLLQQLRKLGPRHDDVLCINDPVGTQILKSLDDKSPGSPESVPQLGGIRH